MDSWGITKNCQNTEWANQFLDFLCREDIARLNFDYIYYSTPNEAVINGLSEEERADETLVPADDATKNCEVCIQQKPEIIDLENELWKKLKAE